MVAMGFIERRAAVNVEYIILIVAGALAVTLGLSYLSNTINDKHIQIAEALIATEEVAGEPTVLENQAPVDNGDGTYIIPWSGGTAPYTVADSTGYVIADGTTDTSVIVTPEPGDNIYTITDDALMTIPVVITDSLGHAPMLVIGEPRYGQVVPNDLSTNNWFATAQIGNLNIIDWVPAFVAQDSNKVRAAAGGGNLSLGFESQPNPVPVGTLKRIDLVVVARGLSPAKSLTIHAEAFDILGGTGFLALKSQTFTLPEDAVYRTYRLAGVPAPSGWDWGVTFQRDAINIRLDAGTDGRSIDVDRVYMDYIYE